MVDKKHEAAESTREGGREEAKLPSVGLSGAAAKPRNSSGSASMAATVLDLRVKLNFAYEMLERCFEALGDAEAVQTVKRFRQTGHRIDRRPR